MKRRSWRTSSWVLIWISPVLVQVRCLQSKLITWWLVRGTPTAGVLIHWVIISRRWERIQQRDSESPINTDSPRKEKCCDAFPGREITGPKTPRTDTILPEHLLAHTLITYVYPHYCIWSFCHHFPCKNDVLLNHQYRTQIEFSNDENKQSLTQTFYLLLAAALSM